MDDNYIENINTLRRIANEIKSLELIDPSTKTVMKLTEIIERCKKLPELEMIDHNPFFSLEEAEA